MSVIRIELGGITARRTAELRADVTLEELMPSMMALVEVALVGDTTPGGPVMAVDSSGHRIAPTSTLAEAGVAAGDTVQVARMVPATDPTLFDHHTTDALTPGQRALKALPARIGAPRRCTYAAAAFLGLISTPQTMDARARDRARDMWRWTDHARRLEWIIGRPRLRRTLAIGVVSFAPGGADLAVQLATALASARSNRVVLIDNRPDGAPRAIPGHRHSIPGMVERRSVGAGADTSGSTTVGADTVAGTYPSYVSHRIALERAHPEAGLVVVDFGAGADARWIASCDQMVVATNRPLDGAVVGELAGRSVVVAIAPAADEETVAGIERSVPDACGLVDITDDEPALQIAALLAGAWR